jgi:UDP-N-acetylmuramate dehydrogenase
VPLFLPHFNLQKFNTLAVPAVAEYFVTVKNDEELREALSFAKEKKIPHMILGGGSNIVLRANFPGLVIHIKTQGREVVRENDEFVWLKVAAGQNWHELVEYTLGQGFYGLENLSLIPGSVGAAPIQNIGAYGIELKDVFFELTALDIASQLTVVFTKESCRFDYRDSIFKQSLKDQYVITSVTFQLRKTPALNLDYPALKVALAHIPPQEISPDQISEAVIAIRQSKLPDPNIIPNVGSFFKNPIIPVADFLKVKEKFPNVISFPVDEDRVKLAAAWLIDQAGWRGKAADGVGIHPQQALVITNEGKRSGEAVLELAARVIESVKNEFDIELEIEPRLYPE